MNDALKPWLTKFCQDVFEDGLASAKAFSIIVGAVDGYCTRHGTPDGEGERRLMEQSGWYVYDNKILAADMGLEDKRVLVIERLETLHGKRV